MQNSKSEIILKLLNQLKSESLKHNRITIYTVGGTFTGTHVDESTVSDDPYSTEDKTEIGIILLSQIASTSNECSHIILRDVVDEKANTIIPQLLIFTDSIVGFRIVESR